MNSLEQKKKLKLQGRPTKGEGVHFSVFKENDEEPDDRFDWHKKFINADE